MKNIRQVNEISKFSVIMLKKYIEITDHWFAAELPMMISAEKCKKHKTNPLSTKPFHIHRIYYNIICLQIDMCIH